MKFLNQTLQTTTPRAAAAFALLVLSVASATDTHWKQLRSRFAVFPTPLEMKLTRTSLVTFFVSAILGAVAGFQLFRVSLIFTPLRHDIQYQFIEACRWGDIRSMERLHLAGASPTALAEHGGVEPVGPPIIEAAEHARPEAVQWLIDHGASVNVSVSDGWKGRPTHARHSQRSRRQAYPRTMLQMTNAPDPRKVSNEVA